MKTFLNFRNNLTMLYKNLPDKELRTVMRVRWWLDHLAMLQALMVGHWREALAMASGRRAFKRWKNQFDPDREEIRLHRVSGKTRGRGALSILYQYYVKGRRTFAALQKVERNLTAPE